jgi:DNA gyrase/topoisomerase IV subunit B
MIVLTLPYQVNSSITIWNNGHGVPVDIHREENVYVPELIFGHLLTSSNYDDDEKKVGVEAPNSCSAAQFWL